MSFVPPFVKADDAVVICIDFGEELVKLGARDDKASTQECIFELIFVQLAILIAINALEQVQELFLGLFHKGTEFSGKQLAPVVQDPISSIPEYWMILSPSRSIALRTSCRRLSAFCRARKQ